MGTESSRFKTYLDRFDRKEEKDVNKWRYISLITRKGVTLDLIFDKFCDVTDFIVAISSFTRNECGNKKFAGLTNPGIVKMMLIKHKL